MRYVTERQIVLPKRKKGSHKGENGRLLVIGGSQRYSGAVALAGLAALRAGADIVTIAAPEKVSWAVNCLTPDLITIKLNGKNISSKHLDLLIQESKKNDVVLIGNGIGNDNSTNTLIKLFLKKCKLPKVIDADAIKAINLKEISNSVLTPHKREFEILLKNSGLKIEPIPILVKKKDFIEILGDNIIILKGKIDTILSNKKMVLNRTGNEGMTKGGTGDVLAGLCAGFASQGLSLWDAAVAAAFFNGKIGDQLKNKKGYSFIASDIVEDLKKIKKIKI